MFFELIKDILNLPAIQIEGQKCLKEINALISKVKNFVSKTKKQSKEETREDE